MTVKDAVLYEASYRDGFTADQIIEAVRKRGFQIERAWCTETLRTHGYHYEHANKKWWRNATEDNKEIANISISTETEDDLEILKGVNKTDWVKKSDYDNLKERYNSLSNSSYDLLIDSERTRKELEKFKAELAERDKRENGEVSQLNVQLQNDVKIFKDIHQQMITVRKAFVTDYFCEGCSKEKRCDSRNLLFNKPCQAVTLAKEYIRHWLDDIEKVFPPYLAK